MTNDPIARPAHGGRLQAKLVSSSDGRGEYALTVSHAEASWDGRAFVAEGDGQVSIGAWAGQGEPSAWLVDGMRALLRSAWQRKRAGHPWPRRLSRWRPGPEV